MASQKISDFSVQWCQDLLNAPELINTTMKTRRPKPPADKIITNTLFSETFMSETTIRAWQTLQAKHIDSPNISPMFVLLLSLGSGLDGYNKVLHGGMFGVIFDQASSMCAIHTAGPTAVTAGMNIQYFERVNLPSVVLCRTVAIRKEGRKLWTRGTIEDGTGTVYSKADTLHLLEKQGKL